MSLFQLTHIEDALLYAKKFEDIELVFQNYYFCIDNGGNNIHE
jgi:hypothetical protein